VLKDKEAETVIDAINMTWNWKLGFPSVSFWADNGPEFLNKQMNEYGSKFGFKIKFGPNYSPWSNSINERNHYSMDITVKKMREADKSMTLQKAVDMAAWAHNTNVNLLEYNPMSLVTEKSDVFLGVSTENLTTDSQFDSESVKKIMENHHRVTREFRKAEYGAKLDKASKVDNRVFNKGKLEEDNWVFYQDRMKNTWFGPVKVFSHRGENVWVWVNGDLKKVHRCKIQVYKMSLVIRKKRTNKKVQKRKEL
jgi:hypothetical protein